MRRGKVLRLLFLTAALLAAAGGFAVRAQRAGRCADGACRNVTLYLKTPLSAESAQALFSQEQTAEKSKTAFAVWGEQERQMVSDPDLGRSVQADVLAFYGAPELVFAQAGLSGDDGAGCLIGEETAWELFGSTGVVGDTVCIGNGTRTICAVMHQPKSGVVVAGSVEDITGSPGDNAGGALAIYNRVTVESRKTAEGEAFLTGHGLDGEMLRFDYLRNMDWLVELIPGKWSDFYGWKENYKRKEKDFELLARVQKNSVELYYESQCRLLAWNTGLAALCTLLAVAYAFRVWRLAVTVHPG